MAHKKGLGSVRNGRDSQGKRLGVKVFAGEVVTGGEIIVRQRGTPLQGRRGRRHGPRRHAVRARRRASSQFTTGRRGRVVSVAARPTPPSSRVVVTPARRRPRAWPSAGIAHRRRSRARRRAAPPAAAIGADADAPGATVLAPRAGRPRRRPRRRCCSTRSTTRRSRGAGPRRAAPSTWSTASPRRRSAGDLPLVQRGRSAIVFAGFGSAVAARARAEAVDLGRAAWRASPRASTPGTRVARRRRSCPTAADGWPSGDGRGARSGVDAAKYARRRCAALTGCAVGRMRISLTSTCGGCDDRVHDRAGDVVGLERVASAAWSRRTACRPCPARSA